MSKEGTLITIGVLTVILPFSGLPHSWLAWILPVFGIVILVVGYLMRKERMAPPTEMPAVRSEEAASAAQTV